MLRNYLLNLNEDDQCVICFNKLTDVCTSCEINGNHFSPNPRYDYEKGETDPKNCVIWVGKCGHVFHAHCLKETKDNKCPSCRKKFIADFTPSTDYLWCSGQISTELPWQTRQNKDDERGGRWKQVRLSILIDMIKNKQSIAKYIYDNISRSYNFSSPEKYEGLIKQYEDSIKENEDSIKEN